jgi:SnoaL-like domain
MKIPCAVLAIVTVLTPAAGRGQSSDIQSKIRHLEDIEQIRTVLLNYGRYLDAHDFAAYGGLFSKDGEWIGGFGSVKGPAAVEAFMVKNIGSPGKPNGTYHLLSNFIIDVNGDTATAWSRWGYVTPGPDKKPVIAQGGHYEDKLVRENGAWKFSRREAFTDIPRPESAATK